MARLEGLETVEELAARWKVPKSWLYARTRDRSPGAIPVLRCGKYLRFVAEKADAWLLQQSGGRADE